MIATAIVLTVHMVNECFGVGVLSEPRMASAGVEPWTGSSTDEHLPRSTTHAGLSFLAQQSSKDDIRMPYLVGIAVPSTGHPDPIRGYAILGYAGRDTNKILIDQQCCLRILRMTLLKPSFCAGLFSSIGL